MRQEGNRAPYRLLPPPHATMPKAHDSRLIKLVGKILHHDFHHHGPQDDSDSDSGVATPEWMGPYRAPSSTSSVYSIPKGGGRDKSISMDLWNEAYNSLRDSTRSAGLVTVYESILCQELSHGQSIGGLNQSLPRSDKERFKALITITESGLKRSRGTKSQANTSAKGIIRAAQRLIKSVWATYPSTAVAWSGICILTPVSILSLCTYRPACELFEWLLILLRVAASSWSAN